jgi:hypothetical protein
MVHVVQVELHWNRYVTNGALENARMVADRGDLKQAREILDAASVTLGASPLVINGDPICLGLLSDLQEGVEKNTSEKKWPCLDHGPRILRGTNMVQPCTTKLLFFA